jgi:hypothetical protein
VDTTRIHRRAASALGAGLVAPLLLLAPWSSGASPAAEAPAAQIFLATTGSDSNPCTKAAPCASFQRAYRAARPGQTVEVASGVYPSQTLGADPNKRSAADVTFRPAKGATVSFSGRFTLEGASHMVLRDLRFSRSDEFRDLMFDACNNDITVVNSTGKRFFILEGNSNVTFRGGRWGGYGSPGEQDSHIGTGDAFAPNRTCNGQLAPPARNIVFDGVTWHDVFWNVPKEQWGGSHPDCFQINGYADGVTIRNSYFLRCGDSFLGIGSEQGPVTNVTVENTTFLGLGNYAYWGLQITSGGKLYPCGNIVLRKNIYWPNNPKSTAYAFSPIVTTCEPPGGTGPVRVEDNIFQKAPPESDCKRYQAAPYGTRWINNLFNQGTPCGSSAQRAPYGYTWTPTGRLRVVSKQAAAIRRIFQAATGGTQATQIARGLTRDRIAGPNGRGWRVATVRDVIANGAYVGNVYGRRGSHPAIVSRKVWRSAQRALRPRR